MPMPTEPIPGSNPTPPVEKPAESQVLGQDATQAARREFFRQASIIGPTGFADRVAAKTGMPTPQPEVKAGPATILTTEPHVNQAVDPNAETKPYNTAELSEIAADDPTNRLRDMAASTMLTGMGGDNLSTPAVPYIEPQPPIQPTQPTTETSQPEQPAPAPKKPWWKLW